MSTRRKKIKSIRILKNEVWKLFSEYVRRKNSDWRENCVCVTCGISKPWKELQAGHFISGRHNSVLFDERNVHPQCYRDNVCKHGDLLNYRDFMVKKYGEDVIAELRRLDRENKKFTRTELEKLKKYYKKKLNELETRKID